MNGATVYDKLDSLGPSTLGLGRRMAVLHLKLRKSELGAFPGQLLAQQRLRVNRKHF